MPDTKPLGKPQIKKFACLVNDLHFGGSQRVMALLVNEFSKSSNLNVHLILYGNDAPTVHELEGAVTVRRPDFKFNKRRRFVSTLRRLLFLRSTIRKEEYDALLSFGERWNSFVMLATLGMRKRIYLSDRSSPELDIGRLHSLLRRLLYPNAAGLIAQTSQARDIQRRSKLNDRICVVPNPLVKPPHAAESGRCNTILSVGRMISTRHYDRLIRIFASLNAEGWGLTIVGDDSQGQEHRSYLDSLVDQLGVGERVEFVGKRSDVQTFYDGAKIFAFTSSSEGFPNAVAEALASGLPVIAYDCVAGPSDLIQSGNNGYLVELFDDATFGRNLRELIEDEEKRRLMSINARNSVAHLSIDRVSSRILDFVHGGDPE